VPDATALWDPLTRLPARALVREHARMALRRADRYDREVALVHLGLDGFRFVNESLGRDAGDRILREAAQRMQDVAPPVLVLGRSGSDEFCALMTDLGTDSEQVVESVAGALRAALSEVFAVDERRFELGATMGASRYPSDAPDLDALFKHAESAMRQAKDREPGSLAFYAGGTTDALERLLLTARLRGALAREELRLVYQPIFDVADGRVSAVEALLRWHDPQRGVVEPARFIPAAEHTGLMGPIGAWVLDAACAQVRRWSDDGLRVRVSVNVSLRQFREAGFVGDVTAALERHGVDPARLTLELTESTAMRDPQCVEPTLAELRELGVAVAIDDFGTGYSSLARLREMEVDQLKIDRRFQPPPGDRRAERLLAATLALVGALEMSAVVEGIETAQQFQWLASRGTPCLAQGFHLARPLAPAAVADYLRR
jgi:diguanylate cyclase (GGDEF)-like protein